MITKQKLEQKAKEIRSFDPTLSKIKAYELAIAVIKQQRIRNRECNKAKKEI